MKKSFMGLVMALFLSLALVNLPAQSQDRGGQSQDHHMGSGMMGRGHGMMHQGPGNDSQYGPQYNQPQKPMDEKDARERLENYLNSTGNPNLKLGEMKDKGSVFEAKIVTKKEGALVDRIAVDKYSGWMRSVY